jgi:hemoglobin-like flavoprotein
MLNPSEVNVAFSSVVKLVNVVLKAFPNVSHEEVAKKAIEAWQEKRETLEDQLTKLRNRKTQSMATAGAINTKSDMLDNLKDIEPVLNAMMDIMRKQGRPAVAEIVKKAA